MKKVISYILVLIAAASLSSCGYNGGVERQERVSQAWSQVENVYQRRADLIPNIVASVKGEAKFEQSTLTAVIEARAKATAVTIKGDQLTPENVQKYQAAQDNLSSTLSRLMVVSEQYPTLQANQGFRDLRVTLEGTENRISVERKNFNDAVMDYNSFIRKFPNNMTAGMFGFTPHGYFTAQAGSDKAPKVEF